MPYRDRAKRLAYHKEYNKKWFAINREDYNDKANKTAIFYRQLLFDILGRECVKCGHTDYRALQFDHIKSGGGPDHRKYGGSFCRYYAKRPILAISILQVLCANCNWVKRYENNEMIKRGRFQRG